MPELPDITVYVESLERHIVQQRLEQCACLAPSCCAAWNRRSVPWRAPRRRRTALGKRIVLALEEELFLVLHLMIAGRLRW